MAIRPEELDFMQSYLNGAPREDLQGRLNSMYGDVTPEMQQAAFGGPDTRTAQNMSVEPAMSVAPAASPFVPTPENIEAAQRAAHSASPPIATDAGGMSVPPPTAPAMSEGPAMSTVSPEQLASMGQQAEARLAASQASATAPSGAALPPSQSPENAEMQRYLIGGYRGGGGKVIPGGEQLASRTVTRELREPMNPELADELAGANIDAQGLAVGQGESAAQQLEKHAAQQAQQAQSARAELASYKRTNAAKQAEYDIRRSELDDMREQIQKEPATYWSGKGVGTQILNAIGLALLGMDKNGGLQAVQNLVNSEVERKQKERVTAINLLQDQLNRFREGIPNPEAQAMYTRSLGLDAAAAEADRMANLAKAEDARQRGFALAEQLRRESLQAQAAAQSASLGKEEIKTQNVPTKVVGGAPGGMAGLLKRAKELGLAPEQALYLANRGELPTSSEVPKEATDIKRRESELERRVVLPNGKEVFAGSAKAAEGIQGSMDAATQLLSNYDALEREVKSHSITGQLDREALGRIRASIADNITTLKDLKGLGVLSKSDLDLINPLSGAQAEDAIIGPQFQGAIQRARQIVNRKADIETAKLLATPWGSARAGKAQSSVSGFKPEK
jgi:hypothetical protein